MSLRELTVALTLVATLGCTTARDVTLELPVQPRVAFSGRERLHVGPFLRESRDDRGQLPLRFDVAAEFERYLSRLLRKESKFFITPQVEGLRLPSTDPLEMAKNAGFWRELGARSEADFIISGSIDFQIQDRTGYKTEEFFSPLDGRTYYRQVLVEQTGFSFDILLQIYDARTGAMVYEEPIKDFREVPERQFDEFTGMFSNLYALENRLIGVFVPRTIKSKRVLFTP
jgi:hypothetical protein